MPVIPRYFTGRKWLNAKVTPYTVDNAGNLTRGTSVDLCQGFYVESAEFNGTVDLAEISGANATMRNYVPIKDDFEVTLTEVKSIQGSGKLHNIWVASDFFIVEVVCSLDGFTSSFTVQAICVRENLNDTFEEGKSVLKLTGKAAGLPMAFIPLGGTLPY